MVAVSAVLASCAAAQDSPTALPSPLPDVEASAAPQPPVTVEQLAERLRAMEQVNRKLAGQLDEVNKAHQAQMNVLLQRIGELSERVGVASPSPAMNPSASESIPPAPDESTAPEDVAFPVDDPVPDYTEGQFSPFTPAPGYPYSYALNKRKLPMGATFGNGIQFSTADDEFGLQIHLGSQIDARVWGQRDQVPGNSGLYLPRQRIFFDGNITRRIEYQLSLNRGLGGSVNILNAFINLHFDDRFELRIGRFFTPLTYEQYAIPIYWMQTPERSVYTTNVGQGRQVGVMGWGYLFDKRLDYAAGVFNGSANSFESFNNSVDFTGYLNARPFQESESFEFARDLNLGTSVAFGYQNQPPVPVAFSLGATGPSAENPIPGTTPFLILNPGTTQRGDRLLGSVHSAYFYKGLSLIGEWQYGYGSYASLAHPAPTAVPFGGFYVTASYLLTGEHVQRRTAVYPLRPVIPTTKGVPAGLGAWELVASVSELRLGEKIFSAGFAEPALWSNQALQTELGVNWYLNEYLKIYTFWLHADFADPVQYRPGGLQSTADMFWLRFQLYF